MAEASRLHHTGLTVSEVESWRRKVRATAGVSYQVVKNTLLTRALKDSPAEDLLRHADHMLKTVGEDHVAIGTDNGPLPTEVTAERKKQLDAWQKQRIDEGIAAPGEGIGWYPWIESYNSIDRYRRFAADLSKRGCNLRKVE